MLRAFGSGSVFGEQVGDGPATVLALHGWARDHHDFDQVFDPCAGWTAPAVAIDLPGFGATPAPPTPWGTQEYARCVAGLLDELAERPLVIGHSFGGRVALHLAARFPERVGGLVLTGVPLEPGRGGRRPPLGYRVARGLRRSRLVSADTLERARQRYGSSDYRLAQGVMRGVLVSSVNERYDEVIATVSTRVELVWGANDAVAPVGQAQRAVRLFPNAHLTVLASTSHFVPTEAPAALRAALDRLRT